ncbi:hypothetical protein D3C72_66510 [compost metagenome]
MSDFLTSIKAALYDRAVNPLFGIFTTVWVICNYKMFVILFSGLDAISKVTYIQYVLYPKDDFWTWVSVLIAPCIFTVASIYIYPLISKPVFQKLATDKATLINMKLVIDERLREEKIAAITRLSSEQRVKYQRQVDDLNLDVARYRSALDDAQKEIMELKNTSEGIDDSESNIKKYAGVSLSQDELDSLNAMQQAPFLRAKVAKLPLRERHIIDRLEELNLIEHDENYIYLQTTAKGRACLVAAGYDLLE